MKDLTQDSLQMNENKQAKDANDNVVLFLQDSFADTEKDTRPSGSELYGSDPLEDLLNEFDHIEDTILDTDNEEAKNTLSEVAEKMNLPEEILAHEFCRSVELRTKMQLLEEVNQRIKYYLDEVEVFIPKLKK